MESSSKFDINNFKNNFKQMFISEKNSSHILNICSNKSQLPNNIHQILIQLQNEIYDDLFYKIYSSLQQQNKLNLEDLLLTLNSITITQLESLLHRTIHSTNNEISKFKVYKNLHLFSNNSSLSAGQYIFKTSFTNVESINLLNFNINCHNIYNITESNNIFHIVEKQYKFQVTIPIGYYSIHELLVTLSSLVTNVSKHKVNYIFSYDKYKNKISIQSVDQSAKQSPFNIIFHDNNIDIPLSKILGFSHLEYNNSTIFVAETHPIHNIFDDLYIKIYINNNELQKTFTSNENSFTYFEFFHLNLNESFSSKQFYNINNPAYQLENISDIQSIAIEIWNSTSHCYTRFINFDIVIQLECQS
jgi:hypothetical protein